MRKLAWISCMALLLLVAACAKKNVPAASAERFEEFYDRFHTDLEFQLTRVQFPLEGNYEGPDGTLPWTREDWQPHRQKVTDIKEPNYDTEIIRTDGEVTDKVWIKGGGYQAERRFQLIKGQWYLVFYETVDL